MDYFTSFAKGAWDQSQWTVVKSPRFDYCASVVQFDDHIENVTPDVSPEEVFKKYCMKVYSCLLLNQKVSGKFTVSSTMSFDHRMAPLIVISDELGKSANGLPELRDHYEVVLYDEGINIWRHLYNGGNIDISRVAFLEAPYLRDTKYKLEVTIGNERWGKELIVSCNGHKFGCIANDLPDTCYVGVIGCEGRNSFYDFSAKAE